VRPSNSYEKVEERAFHVKGWTLENSGHGCNRGVLCSKSRGRSQEKGRVEGGSNGERMSKVSF